MRVTNQMITNTAIKGGITTTNRRTLLDLLGDSSTSVSNKSSLYGSFKATSYSKLDKASKEMTQNAKKLTASDTDSLFDKAVESGSTKDITSTVAEMVEQYNQTLKQLGTIGDVMGKLYKQELTAIFEYNKEALKNVGITQEKDGSLTVDEKALESADIETLKKAFGNGSDFGSRLAAVGGYVNKYASANLESITSQYSSNGTAYTSGISTSKYNFWG